MEPRHFSWDVDPARTMAYCNASKILLALRQKIPTLSHWSDPKTLFVFVLHKHKFVFVFGKELIFVPKTPVIGRHKMIFVTEV
jgi:hypothetical protein